MTSLTLKRFRSCISSRLDFDNPTFLVGRNGAGKSNVVDALNFLADATVNPLEIAFDSRGGIESVRNRSGSGPGYPPNLGLRVAFDGSVRGHGQKKVITGDYAFEIKAKINGAFEVVRERCYLKLAGGELIFFDRHANKSVESTLEFLKTDTWQSIAPDYLMLPWLAPWEGFRDVQHLLSNIHSYAIDPSALRKPQEPDMGHLLKSDGSNAGSVLRALQKSHSPLIKQLSERLAQITPYTSEIKPVKQGKQVALEFIQEWGDNKKLRFEAHSASDGTLRALGILLALIHAPSSSLLIIEEPESSLHPGALEALLEVIQSASLQVPILVTTHSSDLLDAKWIKPENLRLIVWDGGTEVRGISNRAVKALKSHLATAGDLLRSNALGEPLPESAPAFSGNELNLFPEHK